MPLSSSTPSKDAFERRATRGAQATLVLLLLSFAGVGLTACGSSQSPAAAAAARSNKLFQQERAEALELVRCAHKRGIPLPEPDAQNNVSTVGINLKSHHRKTALNFCYQKAVKIAAKRLAAERAKEGKPPTETAPQNSAQRAAAFAQEREHLLEVVSCARRHGLHLPEPDAHNNINTRGLHLKSRHNNIVMSGCFRQVVNKASREQQELAREREAGPRRLGEEPTG